jgi:hypothetical protein
MNNNNTFCQSNYQSKGNNEYWRQFDVKKTPNQGYSLGSGGYSSRDSSGSSNGFRSNSGSGSNSGFSWCQKTKIGLMT